MAGASTAANDPKAVAAMALILRRAAPHVRCLRLDICDPADAGEVLEAAAAAAPSLDSLCIRIRAYGPGAWQRVKAVLASTSARLACLDVGWAPIPASFAELCAAVVAMRCCPGLRKLRLPEVARGRQGRSPAEGRERLRALLRLLSALGPGLETLKLPGAADATDGMIMLLITRFPRLRTLTAAREGKPAPVSEAEWPAEVVQAATARGVHPDRLSQITGAADECLERHVRKQYAAAALARAAEEQW